MLQALVAKRITTIVIDDQIELIDGLYCISANEKIFGQIAAQFISLTIPKSGTVLVTRGRKDSVLHSNKLKSFKAYMKAHCPSIRVEEIGTYYEKYSQEAEHKMTKEIETRLKEERDIRAVFALTSHENQAVARAVIETGRRGDVRTVGTDLNVETVKLLEEEKMDAVINQGARYKGYLAMEEMVDCVIKNKAPQNRANCPIDIVLKSNLALYCATNSIS
jgi:LacI family transcriptional regulator